ncbi:MAG TPA: hypothetical protein VFA81_10855 [Burkholderiales bacterium]|nr:hypothetical protein [Burkholderiales bacterium]
MAPVKLKPSGYITAAEAKKPGYLAKRMAIYRKQVEEEKNKAEAIKAEAAQKVRKLGGRDPK